MTLGHESATVPADIAKGEQVPVPGAGNAI
jgi:hypothetical protein